MRMTNTALILSALIVAASYAAGAEGTSDPGYVGTWASDLAQCKVDQSRGEAPIMLSKDGYDQHETHCKFKSVDASKGQGQWKVQSDCTVEGVPQPYAFTLTVSGDTLTVTDETGARDLLMCK